MFDEKIMCPNCEALDRCSIVNQLPIGYDCSYYTPVLELKVPLTTEVKGEAETISPIKTTIEDGILKVVLKKGEKKVPLYIPLDEHLG